MIKRAYFFIVSIGLMGLFSCGEGVPGTPKPRAYPKVVYPAKEYQTFDVDYCNFTFRYPKYARVQQDSLFFEETPVDPCWFDIYYPDFDSRIYFSYYPIDEKNPFQKLKADAFEMVDYHNRKANYISEQRIEKPNNVSGFAFALEGPAASPFQFFLTDSTKHFVRGSLYFNTQVRPDSLAPVYDFVKEDIGKLIESFEWKE